MRRDPRDARAARLRGLASVVAALSGAALAAPAAAQQLDYTGGLQSATGSYVFTERTTSLALLNGLSLAVGRLRLAATLPVVYQNSTAVSFVGGTPVPTGGPDAGAVRLREPGSRVPMGPGRRGPGGSAAVAAGAAAVAVEPAAQAVAEPGDFRLDVGDPLLQAGVSLHEGGGLVRTVGVHALAKVPLADVASGVGTGEWDYGAGLTVGLGGTRTFLLADASYWVVGDMPDLPLRNTLSYAVSVGRSLGTGRWSVLGSLMGATSMIENADAPLAVGVGVGYAPRTTYGLNAGLSIGLTESSPDVTSFIGWRVGLGGRAP